MIRVVVYLEDDVDKKLSELAGVYRIKSALVNYVLKQFFGGENGLITLDTIYKLALAQNEVKEETLDNG